MRVQASFQLEHAGPTMENPPPGSELAGAEPRILTDPDETLPIPAAFTPGRAVPFSGTRSQVELAVVLEPDEAQQSHGESSADETAMLPRVEILAAQTGSFRDQLGPLVVPLLSLDEYAGLRAHLTVYGEADAGTLARFGVAAEEVREALRKRFAEYFQRDKTAQAQFIASMQDAVRRVRAEREAAAGPAQSELGDLPDPGSEAGG